MINIPTFQEFLKGQEEVYKKFRDNLGKVKNEGIKNGISESTGGYLIVFRHPESIRERLAAFSDRICKNVPAIRYDKELVHTSLSDYGIVPLKKFFPSEKILSGIASSIHDIKSKIIAPVINLGDCLYNQNTAIFEGYPNIDFLDTTKEVINRVYERSNKEIELRLPWGAHTTIARFNKDVSASELEDFFKLMKEAPKLGLSRLEFLDVSSFSLSPQSMDYSGYKRFKLE